MATEFNLDWDSNTLSNKEQDPVDYYKIQEGDNVLRIVGKPSKIETHWEDTVDGKTRKIICPGAGCPICAKGKRPKSRYQCKVIDRRDDKVKMLDVGLTIISQIQTYAKSEEYGDPTKYDIKINRSGKGIDTRYLVMASRNDTPLTPEQLKMVDEFISVEDANPKMSIEEIKALPLLCLQESTPDLANADNQAWNKL